MEPSPLPEPWKELHLVVPAEQIPRWFGFLRRGFGVAARSGRTLMDFLCRDLGLSADTVQRRVQTVLLDGRPVDDLLAARIVPNAVVALSTALPGLAGATLRRGGAYAPLRHTLSYCPATPSAETGAQAILETLVTVKVFNVLAAEWGPELLGRGIVLPGGELGSFLAGYEPSSWSGRGTWDGRPITAAMSLAEQVAAEGWVRVELRAGN